MNREPRLLDLQPPLAREVAAGETALPSGELVDWAEVQRIAITGSPHPQEQPQPQQQEGEQV